MASIRMVQTSWMERLESPSAQLLQIASSDTSSLLRANQGRIITMAIMRYLQVTAW